MKRETKKYIVGFANCITSGRMLGTHEGYTITDLLTKREMERELRECAKLALVATPYELREVKKGGKK